MKKFQSTSQTLDDTATSSSESTTLAPPQHLWRQGCVLPIEAHSHLTCKVQLGSFAMVITHDCDCIRDATEEPLVEVVIGTFIDKADGNLNRAKSTRLLHLLVASIGMSVELSAISKGFIRKSELLAWSPDNKFVLSSAERKILARWLALRYERPALPNELVRRLSKGKTSNIFASSCKNSGEEIQGVYITFDPDQELSENEVEPYSIEVRVVWNSEVDRAEEVATKITTMIREKFLKNFYKSDGTRQEWLGIELDICEAVSDMDFTLRDVRNSFAWKNDEISLGDGSDLPAR
jgi:hypothetical protein